MLAALVTACAPAAAPSTPVAPTEAPAAGAHYPVTVENCGRTVTFDGPPERVVSIWQPGNELLLALGLRDRIVALAGNYAPLPDDLAPLTEGIPILGEGMNWPSKEVMLSQDADLVLSGSIEGFAFDAALGYATVEEIEATGAKVLSTTGTCTVTDSANQTIDSVYNDLRMLGQVFNVADRAETIVAGLQAREAAVVERVAGKPTMRVAYYNGGEGPLFVLTGSTWGDAIAKAGGVNVFPAGNYQVGLEDFAAADPDVILIGTYPGQEAEPLIAFLRATFPDLRAVQNDRLVEVPTIEVEGSIRIIDGLERIARALHP